MRRTALLLAGGVGTRMGAGKPKQELLLGGTSIYRITAERFNSFSCVDDIVFVGPTERLDVYQNELSDLRKVHAVIAGGKERYDSVYNGLTLLAESPPDIVMIHDAVRPFVREDTVRRSISAAESVGAAVTAVSAVDTVYEVENGLLMNIPDRKMLYNVQTPQTFRYDIVRAAHDFFRQEGGDTTDDAGLVHRAGNPVAIIPGSYSNIKITSPADMTVAGALYEKRERDL